MNKQQRKYREMCGPPPARVFPKTSRGSLGRAQGELGTGRDSPSIADYDLFAPRDEVDLGSIRGQRI